MNRKRFLGYLLDILLLSLITTMIYLIIPQNQNVATLEKELDTANTSFFNEEIDLTTFVNRYADITLDLTKANAIYTVADICFIIIWFIGIPLNNNGQTIGQKMMRVKIKRDDNNKLTFNDLFLRALIVNGIWTTLISLAITYTLSSMGYFIVASIISFIQTFIILISCVMIVNSNDARGIQDKISKTHIEEV